MFIKLVKKGQSTAEYAFLFIIVMISFLAASLYIKRGLQGRWKQTIDDFGEQYDPTTMNTLITHRRIANSITTINTEQDANQGGYWTNREDISNIIETTTGTTRTGGV